MYVKYSMTKNPFTMSPDGTIAEALEIMRSNNVRRVPVTKNGKLVGIITERKLLEVSPSPATSLSIFEINYLLSKTKIGDIMTKDVITVTPDTLIEEAAVLMRDNDIGALPVLEDSVLVGIITETDLFDSFLDIMGYRDAGARIEIEAPENRPGVLEKLAGIMNRFNANISHMVFHNKSIIVIRIETRDTDEIVKAIEDIGQKVLSVRYFD